MGEEVGGDKVDGVVLKMLEILLHCNRVEHLSGVVGHKGIADGAEKQEQRGCRDYMHIGQRVTEETQQRALLLVGLAQRANECVLFELLFLELFSARFLIAGAPLGRLQQRQHVQAEKEEKRGSNVPEE